MLVADRFDIVGKGVVLTGQLEGSGVLRAGDTAVADAVDGEIITIEAFPSRMKHATAGANVGLNLGPWAPAGFGAGTSLGFRARPNSGVPARASDGAVVPSVWRTLVGYSSKSRAMAFNFGVLAFDGLRVRLLPKEGDPLLDAAGPDISAQPLRSTKVRAEVGPISFEIVGPQLQWMRSKTATALVEAWRPALLPPPLPAPPLPWWTHLLVTAAGGQMRQQILWRPVLLTMLKARGPWLADPPQSSDH
jgi:hypothetical protein